MPRSGGDDRQRRGGERATRRRQARPGRSWSRCAVGAGGYSPRLLRDVLDRPLLSWHLLMAVFVVLPGLGLAMVLSSSAVTAFRSRADAFAVFSNQAVYAAVGLLGFGVAMAVPVRWVRRSAFPAMPVWIALWLRCWYRGWVRSTTGPQSRLGSGRCRSIPASWRRRCCCGWVRCSQRRHLPRTPRMLLLPGGAGVRADGRAGGGETVAGHGGRVEHRVPDHLSGVRAARVTAFLDPQRHPELTYQDTQGLYALSDGGLLGVGPLEGEMGVVAESGLGFHLRDARRGTRPGRRRPGVGVVRGAGLHRAADRPADRRPRSSRSPRRPARSGWSVRR